MEQQLVIFELANEFYGINISVVESIIKMQSITQLPQSPAYVKGVTNLRGSVLPVIDLRSRFALEPKEDTRQTRIIIVTMGTIKVGVTVDGVSEVLRVSDELIEPLPPMVNSVNSVFLKGIVRLENRLIILLELGKVLDLNDQQVLEALSAQKA
ncbi:MAG: chemotaxis protein CheW [Anaerolineales bacterium]|uniref:chemotaxis protein CheW n=1 Tax=Candidatus Villigracilis saccharophilus TaxID=3140684 RepID=UPI0031354BEB|nr:chemotaxis protein CheW [Anaerolineales bacterium]MBK8421941.1 chemotaxis protein CheW [Anaerolineales bacterium]